MSRWASHVSTTLTLNCLGGEHVAPHLHEGINLWKEETVLVVLTKICWIDDLVGRRVVKNGLSVNTRLVREGAESPKPHSQRCVFKVILW